MEAKDEIVVAEQLKEGVVYKFEFVEFVNMGAGREQGLGSRDTVLDVLVDILEGVVMAIVVPALAVVVQSFDVSCAGGLLEDSSWRDGIPSNVNEHVLRCIHGEVNTKCYLGAKEHELVLELDAGVFDADIRVGGYQ